MVRWGIGCALALALGCGGAQHPDSDPPGPGGSAALADSADRCPMLLGCHDHADDECPDPFFEFGDRSTELGGATLRQLDLLAAEIRETPQLRELRIRGYAGAGENEETAAARAGAIRDYLVEAGIPGEVLDIDADVGQRHDTSYATLEVLDCTGTGGSDHSDAGAWHLQLF